MPRSGGAVSLTVRQATIDDDAALADLFNRSHAGIAGPVVRSAADIGWRCRRQPGMSPEGALLVERDGGLLLGYAMVKDNGDVLELVVERGADCREAAEALVGACERRAREAGADRMRVNVPTMDEDTSAALSAAGWASSAPEARHYVSAIDPGRLVAALAAVAGRRVDAVVIEVIPSDPLPWQEPRSTVVLGAAAEDRPRFSIECDQATLNGLLLGGRSIRSALLMRKLRVNPIRRTREAVGLIDSIAVKDPWFYSLGDVL